MGTSEKIKLPKRMWATQAVLAYLRHVYKAARNQTGLSERSCTFLRQNSPQNLKLPLTLSAATWSHQHCLVSCHCWWQASQDVQGDARPLYMGPCTRCLTQQVSLLHPVPMGDTQLLTLHLHLITCNTGVQVATPAASLAFSMPGESQPLSRAKIHHN